jgi:hypothetical protein
MFVSKLLLNRQKIFNPAEIFQAISSYFSGSRKKSPAFFYRLEWYKIGVVVPVLVYSESRPEMKRFPECQLLETTEISPVTGSNELDYSIFAVPDIGKDWDTLDHELLQNWLQNKLNQAAIISSCQLGPNNCLYYEKNGKEQRQQTVTMRGTLQVTDPERLEAIRRKPLGLAQELGCGLLLLAPAEESAAN